MTIRKGWCLRCLVITALVSIMVLMLSAAAFAEESDEGSSIGSEAAASEAADTIDMSSSEAEKAAEAGEETGNEDLKDQGVEEINKAYDYTVETGGDNVGASADISYGGWASLGSKLSYMKFPEGVKAPDGSDGVWCYCIDISTNTQDGHKYSITNLDAAGYYDEAAAARIRSILLNSYPNMSIEELASKYQLEELIEEEAFMATQWILWYYSNPEGMVDAGGGNYYPADIYKPSEYSGETITMWYDDDQGKEVRKRSSNIVKLAKALDELAPADNYETEPAEIEFNKTVYDDKVIFDYSNTKGLETLEDIRLTVKDGQGIDVPFEVKGTRVIVLLDDITLADDAAELTVSMEAAQRLSKDVYFFAPEGGRDASQSRVSAYEGTAPVAKDAVFALTKEDFEEAEKDPEEPVVPEDPEEPVDPSEPKEPENGSSVDFENPDKPLASAGGVGDGLDDEPKTGDDFKMLPVMTLMMLAMIGIVSALPGRRRIS